MAESAEVQRGMVIKGVTLYDNGYAVFEREATIQGHGSIDLFFSSNLMKSVLETIQFLGEGGSKVDNVAYEATKPTPTIELKSEKFMVNLLKSQMGRQMSFTYNESDTHKFVSGKVLGFDDLHVRNRDDKIPHISVLSEGMKIYTFPINSISSYDVLDPQTSQDLTFSLDLKQMSTMNDLHKLSMFYSDVESPLQLKVRYGFQVTEWKSSYRMKLSNSPSSFHLDGMAIVQNILDEDWDDITLTLVVGAPAVESTRADKDEGEWQLKIKSLSGSMVNVRVNSKDSIISVKHKVAKKLQVPFTSFNLVFAGKSVEEGRVLSDYSIVNNSTLHMSAMSGAKRKMDDDATMQRFVMAAQENLSYYEIPMHVTAKRKQKAIVPLLQVEVEGQKVVLYDESIRKGNPLQAILFENATGRTLEGGPMTISSDKVILGQSTLPTLHPGDESPPIPFAVELDCEVTRATTSSLLKPHQVSIEDGIVKIIRVHQEVTIYKIKNKSKNDLDFLLNHFFLEDYDLAQEEGEEEGEPVDITDRFYQFRFIVPHNTEKKTFVVREENNDMKEHGIRYDVTDDNLTDWVSKGIISRDIQTQIKKVFDLKLQVAEIEREIYDKESEIREIKSNQTHLQGLISSLDGHEKDAAKYVKSLSSSEDALVATQKAIKGDRLKKKNLEASIRKQIQGITYEKQLGPPKPDSKKN